MTFERQALGMIGEELAARELASRGYAILERRYRTRYGEIDIVAEDGELANPGPVPPEPEDATDTGERPGDLSPQAGGPAHED